ncbi:MAG TPA: CBS domain-containing protein [Syntrophorhabdales bacterium]|nr:CBS domain-containing protein [Syntrophorhabdales bacterium]
MKIITTHYNADFDALSSMIAAKKLYPDATLVFPGSQEKSVRDFLVHSTAYFLDILKQKDLDYNAVDTLILVDTKQRKRIGELARLLDNKNLTIHVYDHHPPTDDDIKGEVYMTGSTGACVSMLIGLLKERDIDLLPEEATIMMLGIYEETGSFQYPSTTKEDFDAASFLLSKGANVNVVSEILVKELSPEQVHLLHDLIEAAQVYNVNGIDVVITESSSEEYVGDLAVLVQKFRDMENVNAVIGLFRMDDRIYVIGRSRIPEVDVGHILTLLGGGGHKEAASATVREATMEETKTRVLRYLNQYVKPLWEARDIMFFPVKTVDQDAPISEAKNILTKYNINAMPVTSDNTIVGIISRQIAEKAAFHKLEHLPVKEYMVTEFSVVAPEDSIERVKEIIIGGNQRFVPVIKEERLEGAITRTDLLRILEDEIRKTILGKMDYHDTYEKRRNVKKLMEERLSRQMLDKLAVIGSLADEMGYHAYLVGGFVRDLLLRTAYPGRLRVPAGQDEKLTRARPDASTLQDGAPGQGSASKRVIASPGSVTYDIDIVVEGDGIRFADALAKQVQAKIRTHREFGTAKVMYAGGFSVDIATARLEYYKAPAALPIVEHSSLKLDLYRRDFTINTLAISLNKNTKGELIDFFGAQRDIKEKTIRVLHSLSFVEDPTRVFRAVRFERRFGFQIGKFTMNLIKNTIKMGFLSRIRGSRMWRELSLVLNEENPGAILKRLQELDLLKFIHPRILFDREREKLFQEMDTVLKWYRLLYKGKLNQTFYYLLGALDHMSTEDVTGFAAKLELSGTMRKKLSNDMDKTVKIMAKFEGSIRTMRKSEIYRELEILSLEARLFTMAKAQSDDIKRTISNYITYADSLKPLLTGKTLKQLGIKEGPAFGDILDALRDAKIDLGLTTKEQEIAFVNNYIKERGVRL